MNRPAAILAGLILAIGISLPRVWPEGGIEIAIGLVSIGLAAILGATLIVRTRGQAAPEADAVRRIRLDGLVGRATVLDVRYTGHRRDADREVELRLVPRSFVVVAVDSTSDERRGGERLVWALQPSLVAVTTTDSVQNPELRLVPQARSSLVVLTTTRRHDVPIAVA